MKLFRDDLSQVLRNNYQADISKDNTGVSQNIDLISKYINSCLQVSTDKRKNLSLYFEKSELNDDAIWLYYKLDDTVNTEKIKICNTLLLDLWDDQTNLLIISHNGKESGYRFNRDDTEFEIDLNKE